MDVVRRDANPRGMTSSRIASARPAGALVAGLIAVVLAGLLASPTPGSARVVAPVERGSTRTLLGTSLHAGPAVLTTRSGATLVAFTRGAVGAGLVVKRQVGSGPWTSVPVSIGAITSLGRPELVEDPSVGRILLVTAGRDSLGA